MSIDGGFSRRALLGRLWNGIGQLALTQMLASAANGPLTPKTSHFPPKVKRVIFLYFSGGVSQVDTFDHKPDLQRYAGQKLPPMAGLDGELAAFLAQPHAAMPSPFPLRQAGQAGHWFTSLFEHLPKVADELAFVHGVHVDSNNHAPSTIHLNTGSVLQGSPSVGAWVTYGLGSENQNLPGYVVLHDPRGGPVNGSAVWQNGYLPASFQGTLFRSTGVPILNLRSPEGIDRAMARQELDLLENLNRAHASSRQDTDDLEARIAAYELAYRMQMEAPDVVDLSRESAATRAAYGLDQPNTDSFGRQCLLARRLTEKGVRFVLLVHGWENGIYSWDHHLDLAGLLPQRIREVDQPVTALLRDLRQRGLLDETLVVWTSEMGRTPFSEAAGKQPGRNHNQHGLVIWFAGGGIKAGTAAGRTDDFGLRAADKPIPLRDVHATVLHLLGLDNMALTYLHEGRYKRLTDTGGRPIREILA